MTYDWLATLVFAATLIITTLIGRRIVFSIPAFVKMRELNSAVDKTKLAKKRFREAVKRNNRVGLQTNLFFFIVLVPFCVNLEPRPLWRHVVDVLVVLLVFDFMYYLTHRFLFHGKILRKVHALHHQARETTHVDALFVHPLETFIGLLLFFGAFPIVCLAYGTPINAFSAAIATLAFTQLNTINHTFVNLPYFPFRHIDRITSIHAAHHVDMNQGNYATLTMIYDRIFGTFEEPVSRQTP
jgi:sterol desaturase/sphingolipid hydroxylase (fatty acid hydroxylase superfamily)